MISKDVLEKAVGLADGWEYEVHGTQVSSWIRTLEGYRGTKDCTEILDALASRLTRQIDMIDGYWMCVEDDRASVMHESTGTVFQIRQFERPFDRTTNTINAIVQSEVLMTTEKGEDDAN